MESNKDSKRKKDRRDDDDDRRREKKSKRARSRSRSPGEYRDRDSRRKRRHSRSHSPDVPVKQERQNDGKPEPPARKAKETDMLNTRTGGAYIPPARLRLMQAQITDKASVAYQRLAWEALKKSIHGHINKINVGNIGIIIKELLKENIVRGRGLLCRSVIQAQAASPTFTNVYAALVAAVNSRFPNIGELLLKRLVIQFKRGFKRNDKPICISSASFIAHLVNQRVAHEILALELLTLLVETPTDDSVEVAISFLKECGQKLTEVSSKGVNAIFEMLRNILHEGQLDKRVQYMIEVMFQVWKDGFKDHPALIEELELVPEEEQFTHLLMLDDATDPQDILNVFKFDEKYEENEQKYKTLSKEILGSDAETDEEGGSGESGSDESEDEDDEETAEQKAVTIIDNTETNLVALRRTIYLTINSSLDFEECAHKLMKMQLKPGQEVELCHMFLDCCAEQRTYEKFYGLLAQRFCNINRIYIGPFEEIFKDSYSTAHRLDTNRLRNVSKFFAHLLFTDSISWEVLECVRLNEEDTTSSSRIYIKILFQELAEYMGLKKLNDRLKDPTLQEAFSGVFPRDNPKNTRFSINFFTSIGLGGLTDELREHLKQMPKNVGPPAEINVASSSSSDSSSSSSSSSDSSSDSSSSDSEQESSKKKKEKKKSKSKNKSPKTPEDTEESAKKKDGERWGHDGFYDTYGKDAKRNESRNERDKDNFLKPRDVPRRPDQRNGDDRRRVQEEDYRNRRRDDDGRRDRDRREREHDNERENPERRSRNNDRQERYNRDDRRNRNDSERDSGYESRSRRHTDDDRRDKERSYKDDRNERDDGDRRDKERSRKDDGYDRDEGDRRDRDRSRKDDKTERDEDDRRDKERSRKDDRKERDDGDRRDRDRNRKEDRNERDDDDRREKERSRNGDRNIRDNGDNENDNKRRKYDDRTDRDSNRKDDKRERTKNNDERNVDEESNRKRIDDRQEIDRKIKEEQKDEDKVEKTKKTDRSKSRKDDEREHSDKEKSKKDKKKKIKPDSSSSSSSSDESSSSESSEEEKPKKRDKKNRKDDGKDSRRKRKKDKRDKENVNSDEDGRDIQGESIRREVPERFWDTYDGGHKKRETVDRSPERSEKSNKKRDR